MTDPHEDASVRRRLGRIKNAVDRMCWINAFMALVQVLILLSIWGRVIK